MVTDKISKVNSSSQTWNTGPLLSDSCGYVAISHPPFARRIIVAFRGTYSIANAIVDLSTIPQEYVPYLPDSDETGETSDRPDKSPDERCPNCTVHAGFLASWENTRPHLEPEIQRLVKQYPQHRLTLVGHSLGGAVAGLASLEFYRRGWNPQVTTFGEPRVGNRALMYYFDARFYDGMHKKEGNYRRVTHINDPVPLLPLKEWEYRMHAGEIYISKPDLLPSVQDLEHCDGDEDPACIASGDSTAATNATAQWWGENGGLWPVPKRFRMWELFFAHRDYFWRLGLCVPGGDPKNWFGHYPPQHEGGNGRLQELINP
jgi:pimeloyl-ACP methyl ester carboxylesterase